MTRPLRSDESTRTLLPKRGERDEALKTAFVVAHGVVTKAGVGGWRGGVNVGICDWKGTAEGARGRKASFGGSTCFCRGNQN